MPVELQQAESLTRAPSRSVARPAFGQGADGLNAGLGRWAAMAFLPLAALGASIARLLHGPTPLVSGDLSPTEKQRLRAALLPRLAAATTAGTPFRLADAIPFSWKRVGAFAPFEDIRSLFANADPRIVNQLSSGDRHVVVLERPSRGLVYLVFGPADGIPIVAGKSVCLDVSEIVVSRVHRDCVDYLQFAAGETSAPVR